jgi:hypothetical protein
VATPDTNAALITAGLQGGVAGLSVTDAMFDLAEAAQDKSVWRIFPRVRETGATGDIIALIEKTSA